MAKPTKKLKKFGTFGGVFTPTLLTILGVIMYLRLGWVIGNAGLIETWLIITAAFLITSATALSMSSITTNIRIGSGGAYAIVSQALGLEVGGSLGIPRYLSQALAVTMYIFGFREGWMFIFPEHNTFLVDFIVFLALFGIAYKSANLAIRTQYIIMAVIFISLISIGLAAYFGSMEYTTEEIMTFGDYPGSEENNFSGTSFWIVFAVFFPASTGIMAGANMSGELKDPRKSIMTGTMWAIGVSYIIYMAIAYWLARSASEKELLENYTVVVDKAYWAPAVIAGILGATFSSALASILGSSRILQAMGEHKVLPKSRWIEKRNKAGEPRNAMLITGLLVFLTMLLRDLNAIAPLVTMFFLITYAMLNVVVIIEENLDLISFRPLFRVHVAIPWFGLVSSVITMFIINPMISLVSVAVVIAFYWFLSKKHLNAPFEDVRSGLFISFAEWAAKKASTLPTKQERAWKPNLLVPVEDVNTIKGDFYFLQNIVSPKGSLKFMGIGSEDKRENLALHLEGICNGFMKRNVFAGWAVIRSEHFEQGVIYAIQALRGAFFKPNIVFLDLKEHLKTRSEFSQIIEEAKLHQLGVMVYGEHPKAGLGQRQNINIWLRDRGPHWKINWDIGNLDLSILIAYKLKRNWGAKMRLITVIENEEEKSRAYAFMTSLMELARLPGADFIVHVGKYTDYLRQAPPADLNIFGMLDKPNYDMFNLAVKETEASCMFVKDSGYENIMA
jgi:amino acid transporter